MLTNPLFETIQHRGLQPPKELTLSITPRCNLHCAHCWPEAGPEHTGAPVDLAAIQHTVKQWVAAGLERICLTGGEPLTHPQWREIIDWTCRLAGLTGVRLQTNATLLTQAGVEFLNTPAYSSLSFQMSLDGAQSTTHDRVRGTGSFDRTLGGLTSMAAAGLGARTTVAFTEMAHNFDELPQLLGLLEGIGIGRLVSGTLVRAGRALDGSWLDLPTPDQYRNLITRYQDDAGFKASYQKIGNIACLEWLAGRSTPGSTACRCVETPYITADGRLFPCVMLPLGQYAVEGALSRPLDAVLVQAATLWAELPEFNRRRTREIVQCMDCLGRQHCGGGCLGRTNLTGDDFLQVEDRCILRRTVYAWPAA